MDDTIEEEVLRTNYREISFKQEIRENQVIITIPEQKLVIPFEKPIKEVEVSAEATITAHLIKKMNRKEWEMNKLKNRFQFQAEGEKVLEWFEKNDEVRRFVVENDLYFYDSEWLVNCLIKHKGDKAMELLKGILWRIEPTVVYRWGESYDSKALNLYYNGNIRTFYKNHLTFKIFSLLKGKIVDYSNPPIFYSPESWLGLIGDLKTREKKKILEALRKGEPLEKIKAFVISNSFWR